METTPHTTESRCEEEEVWANRIIAPGANPHSTYEQYLRQHFLGFDWVLQEASLAKKLLGDNKPEHFIFVGSGSMPITAYKLHEYGLGTGLGVDCSETCTTLATQVTRKLDLSNKFSFVTADALQFTEVGSANVVLIGLLVGNSEHEKQRLIEHYLELLPQGSVVLCRAAHGKRSRILSNPIPQSVFYRFGTDVVEHSDFLTAAFVRS